MKFLRDKKFWKEKLKNKYYISIIVFVVWIAFFDRNDFISQYTYNQKLKQLKRDREYFINEIKKDRKNLDELISNSKNLEKFAREKYLMKKENEDIFILVEDK
jgi:cell division protein DivIC